MFKISNRCSIGAAVVVYRELANLLQAMSEHYQQPGHAISQLGRIAWRSVEELMSVEVTTWLFDHQASPPVVNLYISGLTAAELDEARLTMSASERTELALQVYKNFMFMCRKLRQDFRARPQEVTADMISAQRQLQKWCTQAKQEYRQLRNRALFEQGSLSVSCKTKSDQVYMAPSGAW
jgi:hypothetical protein